MIMPTSPRLLNDFSISYSPVTENEPPFPEFYLQADLDAIVPCDFASKPVDGDFTLTDLTSISSQQIAQQLPWKNPSVSCSQSSSRPVAIVDPLNKDS